MSNKIVVIPDGNIFHIWEGSDGEICEVSPDWYELNGTPIDDECNDMKYVRTELLLNEICPVQEK